MPLKFYYKRIFQLQSTSGVRNLCFLSDSQHIPISDWVWTFLNLKFLGFKVWITFVILNHFFQSKINNHRFLFLFKITLHTFKTWLFIINFDGGWLWSLYQFLLTKSTIQYISNFKQSQLSTRSFRQMLPEPLSPSPFPSGINRVNLAAVR